MFQYFFKLLSFLPYFYHEKDELFKSEDLEAVGQS